MTCRFNLILTILRAGQGLGGIAPGVCDQPCDRPRCLVPTSLARLLASHYVFVIFTAMVLLCLLVSAKAHPVIPWTIVSVNETISFAQLFDWEYLYLRTICPKPTAMSRVVSRDGPFNIVDKCLQLDEVCSHFGLFVKLLCDTQEFEPAMSTAQTTMRKAFDVLMQSQAARSQVATKDRFS